jgi:RNA polymerase sigma-70 factor (ECF subfamily)
LNQHVAVAFGTETQYLSLLKQGDENAWMQLLQEWQEPLYQYLCYALPSDEQAQHALGDTMEAVIRSLPQYDGSVPLPSFLYSLAAQRVAFYYRKRKTGQYRPRRNSSGAGEFKAVLHMLPQRYRQALLLRYHLGLSVTEVAQILGKSPQETEMLLAQGGRQLQDAMGSAGLQL